MAVYTQLSKSDIDGFLADYDIGECGEPSGIIDGITNTNYLIPTHKNGVDTRYILTIFEKNTDEKDLPYFVGLMEHLSADKYRDHITCPRPIFNKSGKAINILKNKPALLVSFLDGFEQPWFFDEKFNAFRDDDTAEALGELCARLHIYAKDYANKRENTLSLAGWKKIQGMLGSDLSKINEDLEKAVSEELEYLEKNWPKDLPSGAIHADLFPDNVALVPVPIKGGRETKRKLQGVIDFYYACNDAWMYDVAICINAWGFDNNNVFQNSFVKAILYFYIQERENLGYPVSDAEFLALPILCRAAAMRFLLTRARDWLSPADGALVNRKDPMEYVRKLHFWQETGWKP